MRKFAVVTTYAEAQWESHARRCVESFRRFWPSSVPLLRYEDFDLRVRAPWQARFAERHAARPTDNYRFDAVRFSYKVAAIGVAMTDAAVQHAADVLIWMDADCVTHAPVDAEWLEWLMGGAEFAYLRRGTRYPECGFMMFDLTSPQVLAFWASVGELYKTDKLFKLKEWHDSYAIDHCRAIARGMRCANLSGNAEATSHPFVNGPLGARLDHLKGKRKAIGRSTARDLTRKRPEAYWA